MTDGRGVIARYGNGNYHRYSKERRKEEMADYNRSEAYDLSLYDMPVIKSNAAPQLQPELPERRRQNAPQRDNGKSVVQLRKSSVSSALRALKIFMISAVLAVLCVSILFSKISLILIENEAANVETKLSEARSENTRLVMQLNSIASIEKVDEYAVSVLGMHQLERYQIHYFENSDGDKVAVAGGKTVESKA